MLTTIFKKRLFWFILSLAFSIPAFSFLLKPGYYNMHDDMQMIRQLEMEKCFYDAQIPCRWTPDLGYGYGFPLFNFYPPLPYIVGQVYRSLGFTFVVSVKLTAITQFILATVFMFLLASSIFGSIGGFLASIFYTYLPYHAINIYIRGAMNESWASVFFPLIFYASLRLIKTNKTHYFFLLSSALAFLLLSHNPMALIFSPFLIAWCLFWLFQSRLILTLSIYLRLIFSALFGLSLAAFFTFPAIFESHYVGLDSMFSGYYFYFVHFVSLYQLFISRFWGDGSSIWGPNDSMPFMIGYLHWLVPLLLLLYLALNSLKKHSITPRSLLSILLIIAGGFTLFLTHQKSFFIWQFLSPLALLQFPWRFLNLTGFLLSLSLAILPVLLKKTKLRYLLPFGLGLFLIIISQNYFRPLQFGPLSDTQKFSGKAWNNQISSGITDYLPKTAASAAQKPAQKGIDLVIPPTALNLISLQEGTDWKYLNFNLNQPASIVLSQLYFPDFQVTDNGQPISFTVDPQLGRIVISLSSGGHQIYLKLHNTPIRSVSNLISLFSWVIVIFYIIFYFRSWPMNLISRK